MLSSTKLDHRGIFRRRANHPAQETARSKTRFDETLRRARAGSVRILRKPQTTDDVGARGNSRSLGTPPGSASLSESCSKRSPGHPCVQPPDHDLDRLGIQAHVGCVVHGRGQRPRQRRVCGFRL
jgi:hypothetical protein